MQNFKVNGSLMTMNLPLSARIAEQVGAQPHCCYRNAMLALQVIPILIEYVYIEGWVITHEWPIEHGWLANEKGEVIDPTLALFGTRYEYARYFPGASFCRNDVAFRWSVEQLLPAGHVTPISYRYGAETQERALQDASTWRRNARSHRIS